MSGAPKPRIFLDSNTILDVIERRKNESIVLLDWIKENGCFCCTSAFAHIELVDIEQEFTHITNMLGKRKTLDAIIRERRKKFLTLEQREEAIYRVKGFFDQYKIETWELDRDGWSITLEIMRDLNLKAPDSIHIATALVAGCSIFITNDEELGREANKKMRWMTPKQAYEYFKKGLFSPLS